MSLAKIGKTKAKQLLQQSIDRITELKGANISSDEYVKWKRDTDVLIENVFPEESRHLKEFRGISYYPPPPIAVVARRDGTTWPPRPDPKPFFEEGLKRAKVILESMVDEIEMFWPDEVTETANVETPAKLEPQQHFSERELMLRAIDLSKNCVVEPGKDVAPKVGAIVALDGVILGEAYRGELAPGEHAEYTLLERKLPKETLTGATLYTTLEPCTSRNDPKIPCVQRAIERNFKKVVIGALDRNPKVLGKGETRLLDAGIQIERFDPDLIPRIEELNRDFLRRHRKGIRKRRTRAETKDPVEPEAVGPNGFKIGYTENGDKVEWIEEDDDTWPMILRRNDNDILEMYNELWEKVWYIRKIILFEKMKSGEEPYEDQNQPHLIKALERMRQIEEKYGVENLGWPDVEWGIVQGKLSALSWVMGSEWEGSLDT